MCNSLLYCILLRTQRSIKGMLRKVVTMVYKTTNMFKIMFLSENICKTARKRAKSAGCFPAPNWVWGKENSLLDQLLTIIIFAFSSE